IELPEIDTDTDDSDYEDVKRVETASWADASPLRKALINQENVNPFLVFGKPAPLNMEELFPESKDRFHMFRRRKSSGDWSGADRLTEEE
ncbi:uncharacterized protein B0I36DRAFT_208605, partial [Microdochium trichocladiopsis]